MEQIVRNKDFEQLVEQVARLIESGRDNVRKVVNTSMVYTYYGVGYYIVEFEQGGKTRAEYGKETLKQLSARLTEMFSDGWSVEQLKLCRKFFEIYKMKTVNAAYEIQNAEFVNSVDEKVHSVYQIAESKKVHSVYQIPTPSFPSTLSWSHYRQLMRIKNPDERSFYEIECARQMYVNYYDRYVKQDFEKPTIGILLCKEKNDALVELTLPQDANIYAAEYALYLPDKKLLQAKLKEWIEEEERDEDENK